MAARISHIWLSVDVVKALAAPCNWVRRAVGRRSSSSVSLRALTAAPSEDPRAIAWQQKIAEFDGYVVVTAEYNHSITGALKNAFDQAYVEWKHKPIGFFGYGGVGAARAIEHARLIAVELHMVPVRTATHIAGGDFFSVVMKGEPMESIAGHIDGSTTEMLDQVAWWAKATMAARA